MRLDDAPKDRMGRPIVDPVYGALIRAIAGAGVGLDYLAAERILVISGPARRESSASIRPLTYGARGEAGWIKPRIRVGGAAMLYEIALRPKFFGAKSGVERLSVFLHELWHVSARFDGTLAEDRRHAGLRSGQIEDEVGALVDRIRDTAAGALARELFDYEGELRLRAWLTRPPSREPKNTRARLDYDERDLYSSIIEQKA
jgi:predicted metallopeptidase